MFWTGICGEKFPTGSQSRGRGGRRGTGSEPAGSTFEGRSSQGLRQGVSYRRPSETISASLLRFLPVR